MDWVWLCRVTEDGHTENSVELGLRKSVQEQERAFVLVEPNVKIFRSIILEEETYYYKYESEKKQFKGLHNISGVECEIILSSKLHVRFGYRPNTLSS